MGTIELYERPFMLTGENIDPRNIDFTFFTHVVVTYNQDETVARKEYYMIYDANTGSFSDLAVRCSFFYEIAPVETRTEVIEWFFDDGTVGTTRQLIRVSQQ